MTHIRAEVLGNVLAIIASAMILYTVLSIATGIAP